MGLTLATPVCPDTFASIYPTVFTNTSTGPGTLPIVLITTSPLVFVAAFMVRLSRNPTRVEENG